MKKLIFILALFAIVSESASAFEIDFSRREKYLHPEQQQQNTESTMVALPEKEVLPTAIVAVPPKPVDIVANGQAAQDIVILNTENGFIPKNLSLRANVKYRIYVVNVNEKEKNVSFVMSAFSQFQGTYFGQMKSFEIIPPKEGIYTYECPETSQAGRVVVVPGMESEHRATASVPDATASETK